MLAEVGFHGVALVAKPADVTMFGGAEGGVVCELSRREALVTIVALLGLAVAELVFLHKDLLHELAALVTLYFLP